MRLEESECDGASYFPLILGHVDFCWLCWEWSTVVFVLKGDVVGQEVQMVANFVVEYRYMFWWGHWGVAVDSGRGERQCQQAAF